MNIAVLRWGEFLAQGSHKVISSFYGNYLSYSRIIPIEAQEIHFKEIQENLRKERRLRMAFWTIPTEVRPPKVEPPKKRPSRRRWIAGVLATLGVAALLVFGFFWARDRFEEFVEDLRASFVEEPVIEEPAVEPDPKPVVVAEPPVVDTTVPAVITTVPEVTETTLPWFSWDTEPAPLGLLLEGREGRLASSYQALLSGIVLSVEKEEVILPWEDAPVDVLVLYTDLGEHPQTGETIVGRLLLTTSEEQPINVARCTLAGKWLPEDSSASVAGLDCDFATAEEAGSFLEEGRQYPFFIEIEIYCGEYPEEYLERCFQWVEDAEPLFTYNRELVSALKGGELPDADGLGLVGLVYVPKSG